MKAKYCTENWQCRRRELKKRLVYGEERIEKRSLKNPITEPAAFGDERLVASFWSLDFTFNNNLLHFQRSDNEFIKMVENSITENS